MTWGVLVGSLARDDVGVEHGLALPLVTLSEATRSVAESKGLIRFGTTVPTVPVARGQTSCCADPLAELESLLVWRAESWAASPRVKDRGNEEATRHGSRRVTPLRTGIAPGALAPLREDGQEEGGPE